MWTAAFDPTVGFDASKGNGAIGGMGFRKDSLPIIILASDAQDDRDRLARGHRPRPRRQDHRLQVN
ncbi:MAG: hypothetical protein NVS3B10_01210 [Polyangiales bacterium]